MRRNGPTSLPADDSAIRTDADAVPTSGVRRLAIAGVSLGLAGLLCLGSPVVAFAQDAQPSTDAAPAVTATPAPATPTASATPAPAAPADTAAPVAPAASPAPDAAPAPAGPTTPKPSAPAAPEAPASTGSEQRRGGFSELTATNDSVTVVSNHSGHFSWAQLLANDVNPSGQAVLLTDFSVASHGAIDPTATTTLEYSPSQDFVGKDFIYYSIHDVYGNTNSIPGTITITVTPNQAPVTSPDTFTVPAGRAFVSPAKALLANDTDAEGDSLSTVAPIVLSPHHGSLVMGAKSDGGFTYTPQAGYTGTDSFSYRASDGHGGLSPLTLVELNVVNKFVTAKPAIAGTATVGSTLTVKTGTWTPTPSQFQYQWFRDGEPIVGATQKTYQPTLDDVGFALRAMVIGSTAGYPTEQVISPATASVAAPAAFTSKPVPTITGTARVGAVLSAKAGTWVPTPDKVSYYWKANGEVIAGADITKSTLTLTAAQLGKKVSVTVYVEKAGYGSNHTESLFTAAVKAATFSSTKTPTITGTTKVGSTLTAHSTTWTPAVTSMKYQWKRSGVAIAGATGATYKLTSADLGKTITVVATGVKAGYTSVSKTSAATATVTAGSFTASPTPTISGAAKVGGTLTAAAGSWSPSPTLAYQWKRNGVAITGASASAYTLTPASAGAKITVTVTGAKPGYTSVTKTSAATTVAK